MNNSNDNHQQIDVSLETPGERLKYIRNMLRLTRPYLQEKYKLSIDTLNAWENGKLNLNEKAVDRCIKIYNKEGVFVSKDWVLKGHGLAPKLSISISSYFDSGKNSDFFSKFTDEELIIKEIEFFKSISSEAVVMLVGDDSMMPSYQHDDYIGGRFESGDLKNFLGKDCIVETETGERYFRRLSVVKKNNLCNLSSLNPKNHLEPVLFDIPVSKIAPVIWIRKNNK